MSDVKDSNQLKLRKNGDLTIVEDGQKTTVAHYERTTGRLEFVTKKHSVEFYNQATACIGTVSDGQEPSGLVIRSIGIKGDAAPKVAANAPKRPKLGAEGDAAEDFVKWMLEYDLPQAIVRYGIYCDETGQPIRKKVRRVVSSTVDAREFDDDQIEPVKEGPRTTAKAPVFRENDVVTVDDAIIARRATRMTYTPSEVVGGYQPDDDFEPAQVEKEEA